MQMLTQKKGLNVKAKKTFYRITLLTCLTVLLAGGAACCFFHKNDPLPPEDKIADVHTAKLLLESLANGALHYSVQNGGNGKTNFAKTTFEIREGLTPVVARAVIGCTSKLEHSGGYLCRQVANSNPNNFYFEAYPAPGYSGKTFVIDVSMQVQEKTAAQLIAEQKQSLPPVKVEPLKSGPAKPVPAKIDPPRPVPAKTAPVKVAPPKPAPAKAEPPKAQTRVQRMMAAGKGLYKKTKDSIGDLIDPPPPPPPIRNADPEKAKEILQSIYCAAMHYSIQNGGNGKNKFPTKPTQIMSSIPPVVKNAIVFLRDEEHKAVPVGGYIIAMYPSKSQLPSDDFCYVAYPAKYFRGPHFEIDKTGKITQISGPQEK